MTNEKLIEKLNNLGNLGFKASGVGKIVASLSNQGGFDCIMVSPSREDVAQGRDCIELDYYPFNTASIPTTPAKITRISVNKEYTAVETQPTEEEGADDEGCKYLILHRCVRLRDCKDVYKKGSELDVSQIPDLFPVR